MKVTNYATAVAFALMYSSEVSAVELKNIVSEFIPEENIYIQWGQADDESYSLYDKEPKQTALAEQMQNEKYQASFGVGRPINDKDGDGVEDNVHKTQSELDAFRKPVFGGDVDDIHNTRHGNPPGHTNAGFHPEPKLAEGAKPVDTAKVQASTDEISLSVNHENETSDSFFDKAYLQL